MVSASIRCVCGGRIGLDWWEVFDHARCQAPRPPEPPVPRQRRPAVLREKRKVFKVMEQLRGLSQRQNRFHPGRRR